MMTLEQLIARLREQINARISAYNEHTRALNELRGADAPDQAAIDAAVTARAAIEAEINAQKERLAALEEELRHDQAIQTLQAQVTPLRQEAGDGTSREQGVGVQVREARTYSAENAHVRSFFADAFRAENRSDFQARERLERHMVEVRAEGEMTARAQTTGGAAGLVVPQYLVDMVAPIVRAGRPIANTVMGLSLPAEGMSIIIPRGTTGASVASQATENTSVSNTDEAWTNLTVPIVTIAGQQDVSRQLLERGAGIDSLVYADLAQAYMTELDRQVVVGTGTSGQMLGMLNTAGINQATAFGAAATVPTFYSKTAGQINAVETTRFLAPTIVWLHPRRWNWLIAQLDSQNRPLVVPTENGPVNAIGVSSEPIDVPSTTPVGRGFGLPFVTDANIPTSVGTGPEDQVIVARREDLLLWEDGDGMPRELRFEQTLGNQLTTKLVVYGYAAFTAGRYPTAVGVVGGNAGTAGFGLVAPTF